MSNHTNASHAPVPHTERDDDAVRLFVGQLPRAITETEMKTYFEEFGPICELNLLQDKASGLTKGEERN